MYVTTYALFMDFSTIPQRDVRVTSMHIESFKVQNIKSKIWAEIKLSKMISL